MRPINYEAITAMKKCIQENMVSGKTCLTLRSITEETGVPFQTVGRYIQQFIDRGEIATDDECYYPEPEKHRVRLHPENDTMKDFFVRECIVQGVAKKVFKMRKCKCI